MQPLKSEGLSIEKAMALSLSPTKDLTTSTLLSSSEISAFPVFDEILIGSGSASPAFCQKFSGEHDTERIIIKTKNKAFIISILDFRKDIVKTIIPSFNTF